MYVCNMGRRDVPNVYTQTWLRTCPRVWLHKFYRIAWSFIFKIFIASMKMKLFKIKLHINSRRYQIKNVRKQNLRTLIYYENFCFENTL